ncbi:MAG: aminotransferase class I/II-fold pyridoxal phosphate-dependent enzyme [Actinomycetia bacterium]|nr:aminotransferase class I/II-fold pyridoxal phosphate-dependent enzyme [Actinomycetes bacterium]
MTIRPWLTPVARSREAEILVEWTAAGKSIDARGIADHIDHLASRSRRIHEHDCLNLNPATNVMNPRAEALMAAGLGSRPSLGHAGEKYETGLEAIEEIEVLAAGLAARVFNCRYPEVRTLSGAMANLYAFMATCQPGDSIIVPPPSIGGHVTHSRGGAAGLYGLDVHEAPINPDHYTVDVAALADLAAEVQPQLITIGASLNLFPHPVAELREVADSVGARLLFDAAHTCGMIAGGAWPNPLDEGADLMTMSTYKSLGGPPGGLVLTNDEELGARIDAIAHPGLTANSDAGRIAALAVSLLDWVDHGADYARVMVDSAVVLARSVAGGGLPVHATRLGSTASHQFAIEADGYGGGYALALNLRHANLLACGIGLPTGDGLRIGTPELVRWGMGPEHMVELGGLIVEACGHDPTVVAPRVTEFRSEFRELHFINKDPGPAATVPI